MVLNVLTGNGSYNVIIERNSLNNVSNYFNLNRKVLILTDSGIPTSYIDIVKNQCKEAFVFTIRQGEESKNIDSFKEILIFMVENNFTRTDCLVSIGGGVVGDLGGFCASCFNRGIDFYNIPTTLLSQVDSSIGGKTAIDFCGYKNIVGAFYPPMCVVIDPNVLKTLDKRQLHAGLVEAIKMAATSNEKLFELIESSNNLEDDLDEIIYEALLIKKSVVENDEKEKGLRKILNFGHTIGHAIESASNLELLHGECVGLGMLYFSSDEVRKRILNLLKKYNLVTSHNINSSELYKYLIHDKKASGSKIDIVKVEKLGSYVLERVNVEDLLNVLE